ncbi:hypothetical protein PSMK_17920 [Phycisphaera mikurensis NBRC 102666]|uniref:Uncharacterized protein n=1 Tax=Phycisphaera mikurensis (strain NBRC 102666 / KCTC 22515 / FYK2301M01) TaxID=1142394 RepID=I0IFB3_PHYMF|nr:hypothetical protein PSMK_17920 [Phycisphaera mikurensis NBRC 102666]
MEGFERRLKNQRQWTHRHVARAERRAARSRWRSRGSPAFFWGGKPSASFRLLNDRRVDQGHRPDEPSPSAARDRQG